MNWKQRIRLLIYYAKIVRRDRKSLSKARVFFLRYFLSYRSGTDWLYFIDSFYKKYGFEHAPWELAGLPIRGYASTSLSKEEKFALIKNHYMAAEKIFDSAAIKKILSGQPIRLATLPTKDQKQCYLELAILWRYWREGGFVLYLIDDEQEIITTLTFSFGKTKNDKKFIMIGGLQGTPLGKAKVVQLTRALRGLRPKYLLLECCYNIAANFGAEYLVATSNKNHVFAKQEGKINASYDEFWEEVGGIRQKDGDYLLPKLLPKRNFEDVPQKKRKDWLARQEYLKQIKNDFDVFFTDSLKNNQNTNNENL